MSGRLLWKTRLDEHAAARITGGPAVFGTRLYVPVSSLEEVSATAPGYGCCKFSGSVAALDVKNKRLIWQTYTIFTAAKPYREAKDET